ncbi:hypothetical protein FOXYSP1_09558 [Fusarium oxysporum f. sp. phaseoli]
MMEACSELWSRKRFRSSLKSSLTVRPRVACEEGSVNADALF